MRIAVVVVFLNEEEHLGTMLESLAEQTRQPDRIVLVDDGSSDRSPAMAEEFVGRNSHARFMRRPRRMPEKDRLVSASEFTAFAWAVDHFGESYDVVAKLDADLRLPPTLLVEIEKRFKDDPQLGITGPYLSEPRPDGQMGRLRGRPEHVNGATKFYRFRCYEEVYPLPALLNLDIVDELKARACGWRTMSFEAMGGDAIHLRPMGTRDGLLRGFRRWGTGDYVSGSHPLLVLFVGLQRLRDPPLGLGAVNYLLGWLLGALRRTPRFPPELRKLRRQEQTRRVLERLSGFARR